VALLSAIQCSKAHAIAPEQVIADQTTFQLSPAQEESFAEALDCPPMLHPKPRLKKLFHEKTVLEQ
jgi:uncharacterized protein (DUF1778 family)